MRRLLVAMVIGALAVAPTAASAQTEEGGGGVSLSTAFPGLVVEPGSTASFTLIVSGADGAEAPLSVTGLPDGWTASFRGGAETVDRVAVRPPAEGLQELSLDVSVPDGAADGTTDFEVSAGSSTLDLSVTVQAGAAGSVTLTPDFPGLRGPSDGDFSFTVTVANDTAADAELELAGTGPEGWTVTAEPTGQSQASAITVAAGETANVTLTATPPPAADAGVYEVGLTATGEGIDTQVTMGIELIGDLAMDVTTVDQRLNAEVTGGEPSELPLVVFNTGTASLTGVSLSASAPTDWEVSVEPEVVPQIAPGESVTFTATIDPSSEALAGDYDLTFSATADGATDDVAIRTTVTPSAVWGIVGIGLIALTLAGLAVVFRRFGRR